MNVIDLEEKKASKQKQPKDRYILLEMLGLTELKLARKFMKLEENEGKWIYNKTRRKWMYWGQSQGIWVEDTEVLMYKKISTFVENLSIEFLGYDFDDKEWGQIERFLIKMQSAQGLRNIMNCCMAEARIVSETDLDNYPYLINFKNGMYNLETNDFTPHDYYTTRPFLLTKRCEVNYIEGQTCPLWEKTLNEIFLGDQTYIDYVQRIFGYSLLGKDKEHAIFIIQGETRTGKSTVFNPIIKIMGDYYKAMPDDVFTGIGKDKALVLAESYGVRFSHISETEKGAKLVLSLLKRISGGSPISGRRHHENYFTYIAPFKVFIETNDNPVIGDDNATWERVHNIKFERYFKPEERDKDLTEKLGKELEGILQWLIEGWKKYQERGLKKPQKAVQDTQAHKDEHDTLKYFIDDSFNLTANEDDYLMGEALYEVYKKWAEKNGIYGKDRLTGIQFGREMKKRKEIIYKSKRIVVGNKEVVRKVYVGMELRRG